MQNALDVRGSRPAAAHPVASPLPARRVLGADGQRFSVRVHDDVEALPDHWPRAGRSSGARSHVFQTAEFLRAWVETFGRASRARTYFVEARDADGALALLAPFSIARKGGARILSFVDAGAADYNAPILFETPWEWTPRNAAAAWSAMKTALPPFDVAMFDKMPAEVGGVLNPFHLLATGENPEGCHATDLRRPWPEIEKRQVFYGKRMRRVASLAETTPVEMTIAEDAPTRARILAALLEQKQRRFEETRVPGFDAQQEKRAFYERATDAMAKAGALHLSALSFGGDIVAAQWSLIHDGRYYALVGSFDGRVYGRYSPGKVLYLMLLKHLFERGIEIADLGVGDEAYKKDHCDITIPLSVMTETQTAAGRFYLARLAGMARLRASALWRKLRPLKWIVLRALRRGRDEAGDQTKDQTEKAA